MSEPTPRRAADRDETAVDDVRRIRERLSREAGNDPRKLVEASNAWLEQNRQRLNLKVVQPPDQAVRPEGTTG